MKVMPKVTPPQFTATLSTAQASDVEAEASLEAVQLVDADLSGLQAQALGLDEVIFEKVICAGAVLPKFVGRDVLIKQSDFSGALLQEASLQRVVFDGGRMTGFDASRGVLKDVVFQGCKLDMANFRYAKLTRVRFVDCVLVDADFISAELSFVAFERCLLERTAFTQCKLQQVDLRSSQLVALTGWSSLKGAVIDSAQLMAAAPYLAEELGIKILD